MELRQAIGYDGIFIDTLDGNDNLGCHDDVATKRERVSSLDGCGGGRLLKAERGGMVRDI